MCFKTDNENIFMINVNPNTVDELLDKGMSFKEINKIMRLREKWKDIRKEDK